MKRIFAVLLCVVMMLSVLTACGDSGTAGTETPAETAAPAPTEAAAETPAQQDVTLHLFHQKQEAQEAFAQIIDAFHAEYPYITVEQEIVTNDPAAILKARIATGEVPDIFQGANDTMDIAQGGYIMELTGEPFLNNITDEARSASSFTDADGHTWAMPVDGSCEGIFYNKDIFAKYDLAVPTTLSELETVIRTLEENGVTPFAMGFKDAWTIKPVSLVAASSAIYGKDITWDTKKNEGEASFAGTEGWSTTFELTRMVYMHGNTRTAFDTDYNGACAMMANGEAAMMINGLWALEPIRQINPDVNLGMMAMPASRLTTPSAARAFSAPSGLRAPYLTSCMLTTVVEMHAAICSRKLARPRVRMSLTTAPCSFMQRRRSLIGTLGVLTKYHNTDTKESAWPHSVAAAEPGMPKPSTMTKR